MSEKRAIKLRITEEQFYAIFHFFNHSNWDFNECTVESEWSFDEEEKVENVEHSESQEIPAVDIVHVPACSSMPDDHSDNGDNNEDGVQAEQGDDRNDDLSCPHCFLLPCVTTHHQSWLGAGAAPHERNASNRKRKYRLFWNILSNSGGWTHTRYIAKKMRALARDPDDNTVLCIWTVREIMPDCVLNLVRTLYPNPPNQPYMGHKWY